MHHKKKEEEEDHLQVARFRSLGSWRLQAQICCSNEAEELGLVLEVTLQMAASRRIFPSHLPKPSRKRIQD
jgi:hypothetical protein